MTAVKSISKAEAVPLPNSSSEGSSSLWLLRFHQGLFSMAQGLNLRRLTELVHGTTTLSDEPIWLLGTWYGVRDQDASTSSLCAAPEVMAAFQDDFKSRIWCTYRRDITPLEATNIASDVGWGCTFRSGQMLLAEALSRVLLGRQWQRKASTELPPQLLELLALFSDTSTPPAALSLQQICTAGKASGVVAGKWLGPWMLCKSLQPLVEEAAPYGLRVHVVCDPGGGAPQLDVHSITDLLTSHQQLQGQPGSLEVAADGLDKSTAAGTEAEVNAAGQSTLGHTARPAVAPEPAIASEHAGAVDSHSPRGVSEPAEAHETVAGTSGSAADSNHAGADGDISATSAFTGAAVSRPPGPLLLLLPLTLGLDKMNPCYWPQLQAILSYPQSVGIVGGRPSASLYFVGTQGDNLLYLDPHEAQPAAKLPEHVATYFCDTVRVMPLSSMDPSLAIGFLVTKLGEFEDLVDRLRSLAQTHRAAPIVTIATGQSDVSQNSVGPWHNSRAGQGPSRGGSISSNGGGDDWEMV